jgi:hypothetical protein
MKKQLLTLLTIFAMAFVSCEKDEDSGGDGTNGGQTINPYNTAFNVVLKTPTATTDSSYNQVIWNTYDAKALKEGEYIIQAKDALASTFMLGTFNIATGTQTVMAPSFIHHGEVKDLSLGAYGVLDIQSVDETNQLISGTYEYSFAKYFQSSTSTFTISRTGELTVTFNNVHYDQ